MRYTLGAVTFNFLKSMLVMLDAFIVTDKLKATIKATIPLNCNVTRTHTYTQTHTHTNTHIKCAGMIACVC